MSTSHFADDSIRLNNKNEYEILNINRQFTTNSNIINPLNNFINIGTTTAAAITAGLYNNGVNINGINNSPTTSNPITNSNMYTISPQQAQQQSPYQTTTTQQSLYANNQTSSQTYTISQQTPTSITPPLHPPQATQYANLNLVPQQQQLLPQQLQQQQTDPKYLEFVNQQTMEITKRAEGLPEYSNIYKPAMLIGQQFQQQPPPQQQTYILQPQQPQPQQTQFPSNTSTTNTGLPTSIHHHSPMSSNVSSSANSPVLMPSISPTLQQVQPLQLIGLDQQQQQQQQQQASFLIQQQIFNNSAPTSALTSPYTTVMTATASPTQQPTLSLQQSTDASVVPLISQSTMLADLNLVNSQSTPQSSTLTLSQQQSTMTSTIVGEDGVQQVKRKRGRPPKNKDGSTLSNIVATPTTTTILPITDPSQQEAKSKRTTYLCNKCKQPKKGHNCPYGGSEGPDGSITTSGEIENISDEIDAPKKKKKEKHSSSSSSNVSVAATTTVADSIQTEFDNLLQNITDIGNINNDINGATNNNNNNNNNTNNNANGNVLGLINPSIQTTLQPSTTIVQNSQQQQQHQPNDINNNLISQQQLYVTDNNNNNNNNDNNNNNNSSSPINTLDPQQPYNINIPVIPSYQEEANDDEEEDVDDE